MFVRSLPEGQGAARAGLLLDDEIVAIEGKDVQTMTPEQIRQAVRGDVGSSFVVTILRDSARKDVKITRSPLLDPQNEKK